MTWHAYSFLRFDAPFLSTEYNPSTRTDEGLFLMRSICPLKFLARLGLVGLFGLSATAHAQTYPVRPIKAIVPYAAGGFSDQASRVIAEAMSRNLGQNIVIENRAGGGGRIGSEAVSKMTPVGYQLLLTSYGT